MLLRHVSTSKQEAGGIGFAVPRMSHSESTQCHSEGFGVSRNDVKMSGILVLQDLPSRCMVGRIETYERTNIAKHLQQENAKERRAREREYAWGHSHK